MFDQHAMYIGYTVMIIGGALLALCLILALAAGAYALWWRALKSKYTWVNVREAILEWKSKHPDKADAFNRKFK